MKIVFYSPENNIQPWLDKLGRAFPHAEVWSWEQANAARQADYAVLWAPPAELFVSQKRLKAVFNIGAGVDRLINMSDLPAGVPVVRLNDAGMAVQMAEYVCHALIRHTRRFDTYDAHASACEWTREPAIDRQAFPVGIMGLGDIGARVARAVASFDYPTLGWSRTLRSLPGITCYAGDAGLEEFLPQIRVLVCVLPLTPETEGILNATTLSKLKPNAFVINVARGRHLVDSDLLQMLASGHLAGATLDVFREEPLSPQHPFWRHPAITITPHISAITLLPESVMQIAEKIRALERGESIDGVIEPGRGY